VLLLGEFKRSLAESPGAFTCQHYIPQAVRVGAT
jgi:hypothetical protein